MFWKKKKKAPITNDDRLWVEESLNWLKTNIGEEHFMSIKTIKPTTEFYDIKFNETKEDAELILKKTMDLMKIHNTDIKLEYFSDQPIEMPDGSILSSPADINGKWKSASGTYENKNNKVIISIETQQLKDPVSLIATISHELAHQILLGENRIQQNDEFLTDLTAIAYGFGIFIGNSKFKFSNNTNGWQTLNQGYLPEQIIAYTMAWLSRERNENTEYSKYLNKSMAKFFKQSEIYLKRTE